MKSELGRPDDKQVLMPIDPFAGNELLEQRRIFGHFRIAAGVHRLIDRFFVGMD